MNIEAAKVRCAAARGDSLSVPERTVMCEIDLPDAIELIEEMERLLARLLSSAEACPWCHKCMEGSSTHATGCDLAAVLAKVRPSRRTSGPACDTTDGKVQSAPDVHRGPGESRVGA